MIDPWKLFGIGINRSAEVPSRGNKEECVPFVRALACCLLIYVFTDSVSAGEKSERGYQFLRTKPYLPPDFDQEVFNELWTVWPKELREQARLAGTEGRRKMAFSRYGLIDSPEKESRGAMGYIVTKQGNWVMNCLACHGGKVMGKSIPGLPNSHYLLETLTEDVTNVKLRQRKKLGHMDVGSLTIPLGTTRGTTNAVVFGVALEALRNEHMELSATPRIPQYINHDVDAPPWWNVKKKTHLYYDGMVVKKHRPLMQFVLHVENGPERLKQWEPDFEALLEWIEQLEPPKYPGKIDEPLAARGESIFIENCAKCHGHGEDYPNRIIPLEEIGTDPIRLKSITDEQRAWVHRSWLGEYEKSEPPVGTGYIAPPLDGIWASAPYLHNGSVPTLWHLFHPEQRPVVWKRTEDGYDHDRIGLEVQELPEIPASVKRSDEMREFFDTRRPGKSNAGHTYPAQLTKPEKRAVMEFLKTL